MITEREGKRLAEFNGAGLDVTTRGDIVVLTATSKEGEPLAEMGMKSQEAAAIALQMLMAAAELTAE